MLRQIRTKRDFARYLKVLVVQSGLTLRVIEENTREQDPKGVCCRSTCSDMLRHEKVPTAEPVMACLLTVLRAAGLGQDAESEPVQRRTQEAPQVWRQLMRPPSGAPVLVAADGEPAAAARAGQARPRRADRRRPEHPGAPGASRTAQRLGVRPRAGATGRYGCVPRPEERL